MSDVAAPAAAAPSAAPVSAPVSTPSPAASTPASVSATPAATPESGGSAPASTDPGPIPYARFKEVNDQLKAAKEFQEQYAWAKQFQSDPNTAYSYIEQWMDQLAGHADVSPKLLAKAARMLQSRRGQQQPAAVSEEPQPDVPIQDANGNLVSQTYSASQLKKWQDWNWSQREAALSERLQPLEAMRTNIERQQQQAQIEAQSTQQATSTLTELRAQPYFKEHEAAIKQALIEHEDWGDNVYRAYTHVLTSQVLPSLSQKEQAKVLDHLQTQANGGTVNPGQTAPTQAPKFKDFGDALRYYAEHPDEAAAMAKR